MILAPAGSTLGGSFHNPQANAKRYGSMLASVQRFRGAIYSADGAVPKSLLTSDGRHRAPGDEQAWHLISMGPGNQVRACLRYLEESDAAGCDNLLVRHAAALNSTIGNAYRDAVEDELGRARTEGLRFGEVGGWAVDEKLRNTTESVQIILAMYGLLELLGGCLGVATATWRHHSAGILRRIGLRALEAEGVELPPYFEPMYDCQMELLRFDSRRPNLRYRETVHDFAADLRCAPVICGEPERVTRDVWGTFGMPAREPALA